MAKSKRPKPSSPAKKPAKRPTRRGELGDHEVGEVTGGFNPQPDPPAANPGRRG